MAEDTTFEKKAVEMLTAFMDTIISRLKNPEVQTRDLELAVDFFKNNNITVDLGEVKQKGKAKAKALGILKESIPFQSETAVVE